MIQAGILQCVEVERGEGEQILEIAPLGGNYFNMAEYLEARVKTLDK